MHTKLYMEIIVTNHILMMNVTDCTFLNKILWNPESYFCKQNILYVILVLEPEY